MRSGTGAQLAGGADKVEPRCVCAVIVSYHPTISMIEHMSAVLAQTQGLVAVDNGSREEELRPLRSASQKAHFHLIENGENLGIAEALNRGVRWAKNNGYSWVILFDQDSRVSDNFVSQMLETFRRATNRDRVAIVAPHYVDKTSGTNGKLMRTRNGKILATITSGSMMPVCAIDEVGHFDESLFVDYVDFDFCLRARRKRLHIIESHAVLFHSLGHSTYHRVFGLTFVATNHSAARRYYITRNRLRLLARYSTDWQWAWRESRAFLLDFLKIMFLEADRWRKLCAVITGTVDALNGKVGKTIEL